MSGYFTYDANTNGYTDWLFTITSFESNPYTIAWNASVYPGNSTPTGFSGWNDFVDSEGISIHTWFQYVSFQYGETTSLNLNFYKPTDPPGCFFSPPCTGPGLTDSGGTARAVASIHGLLHIPNYTSYYYAVGASTVSSVPEPFSAASMGIGIISFVVLCFRKRRQEKSEQTH